MERLLFRALLVVLLVGCLRATNDIILTDFQTNLTAGDNTLVNPVGSISYTNDGKFLAASVNQIVSFFTRTDISLPFVVANQVSFSETVLQLAFRGDGFRLAAVGTTMNNLYLLSNSSGAYALVQTLSLGVSKPTSITWSGSGERLIVGMNNGTLLLYGLNISSNSYYQTQVINTGHTSIANVSSAFSRFATCGTTDQTLYVYYLNPYFGTYSLNQTVTGLAGMGCTSLDFAQLENIIAVGRSTGIVTVLLRDDNFNYSAATNINAHPSGISFSKWSSDSVYLLTAGSTDGTTKLWTTANSGSATISIKAINGSSVANSAAAGEFAVGTYGTTNGPIFIERLSATNCENFSSGATCVCNSPRIWKDGNCSVLTCTGLSNSPGTILNSTTCACNTGWIYNSSLLVCVRNCLPTITTNSNGTNYEYNSCFCVNGYQWQNNQSSCFLYCPGMAGSTGVNLNSTACVCSTGYTWNQTLCTINCTGIVNSNGTNASPVVCNCNAGYAWNATAAGCWINCVTMTGSTGFNINATMCTCSPGYTWNSGLNLCYVNCSVAPHSNGTNTSPTTCGCSSGYYWNTTLTACSVNCTGLANSNQTNNGPNLCFCNPGFSYLNGVCITAINCTGLANSPGTNFNATWCNCNSGYIFRPNWLGTSTFVCQIDCSQYPHADASRNALNFQTCTCAVGYTWTGSSCVLTCANMRYSNGKAKNGGECECSHNYRWDKQIGQCVAKNSDSDAVAIALGVTFGILGFILICILLWYFCKNRKKSTNVDLPAVSTEPPPTSTAVAPTTQVLMPMSQVGFQPTGSRVGAPAEYRVTQTQTRVEYPVATAYSNPNLAGSQAGLRSSKVVPFGPTLGNELQPPLSASQAGGAPVPPPPLYTGNPYQYSGGPRDSQAVDPRAGPRLG